MDKITIRGGKPLKGSVQVSGSKNAILPILCASLLTDEPCVLERVPDLHDVRSACLLLNELGKTADWDKVQQTVTVSYASKSTNEAPYDLVRKMRASVLVLGPLLARYGNAKVSLPGGCAIGSRPVDIHLKGLEKLGATIELSEGYIIARSKRLVGDKISLAFPSVGATENLLMAAALAQGETLIENCAREPEISDLAEILRKMGAQIEGDGTETIRIQGKSELKGCHHKVIGDRIEAGTYLAAGFITGGDVTVNGIQPQTLESVLLKFEEAGARVFRESEQIRVVSKGRPNPIDFETEPFPGFPTDMQAQLMAVLTLAQGESKITETIFENRFMHVSELRRLGADIRIDGKVAVVHGVDRLKAAPLMATDLRASASLLIAALAAEGKSVIQRIYHLDRGYERIEEKLGSLGADVTRES